MLYPPPTIKQQPGNTPAFPAIFGLAGTGTSDACEGAVAPSWNRQRRCRLDLLHGETRGDVLERHRRDQLLVERIVARDVGDDHAQHVVDIAGHAVELHHLGHGADLGGEPVKPLLGMVAGLDRDENGDTEPELVLIDERDPPLNHAVGFQPLDTLPTWRRGQAHQTADLGDRVGGILLQQRENLAVDGVHRGQTPCKGNKCNLDGGGRMISSLPRVFEVYRENYSPATEIDTLMASPLQLAASKASTSARRGAAMLPPRRVHLSPA